MKNLLLILLLIFSFSKKINAQFSSGVEFDLLFLKSEDGKFLFIHNSTVLLQKELTPRIIAQVGIGHLGNSYSLRYSSSYGALTNAKEFANQILESNTFVEDDRLSLRKVDMNVRHITIPIGLKYKLFKSRNEIFQLNLRGKYQLNFLTKAKANVQIVQYENPFGINFWLPYSVVGNTVYDSVLQNYFEDVNNDFYSFFQAGLDLDIFLSKKVNLGLGFNWTHINNSPSSLLASPIKGVGMSFAFKYVFSKKDKQILPLK